MKILIAEKLAPRAVDVFRDEPSWTVLGPDQLAGKLSEHLPGADALIVRSAVQVDAALLAHANGLKVIGRAGVGVDNIDLDAATKAGIAVLNTPGANAVAVAEHTFALMLALARHLVKADTTTRSGKWEKKSLEGTELRGKTLGVVGLGRIGMEVARRGRVFQMEVVGHDPFVSVAAARDAGVTIADLEDIFARADYLTLHVGLTPQTRNLIAASSIKKMQRGVRIINCARGELIDEGALATALASGQVGGAAFDVYTEEPPKSSPLLGAPNVVCTPHIAGSTREAQEAVAVQIAQQVREYLARGVIQNAVNVPSVSYDEYKAMQPYIVLAERLASFLVQAAELRPEEIAVRFSGAIAGWRTDFMRNAAVLGVLSQAVSDKANLVNAASIAAERGIRVHESAKAGTSGGGAANVITITLQGAGRAVMAKGTVLHGSSARLLALDDIDIEAPLGRNLLFTRSRDVPGVIGRLGTVLGEHGINIASFSLGRPERSAAKERDAIAVIEVDERVTEKALAALRQIEAVRVARAIAL